MTDELEIGMALVHVLRMLAFAAIGACAVFAAIYARDVRARRKGESWRTLTEAELGAAARAPIVAEHPLQSRGSGMWLRRGWWRLRWALRGWLPVSRGAMVDQLHDVREELQRLRLELGRLDARGDGMEQFAGMRTELAVHDKARGEVGIALAALSSRVASLESSRRSEPMNGNTVRLDSIGRSFGAFCADVEPRLSAVERGAKLLSAALDTVSRDANGLDKRLVSVERGRKRDVARLLKLERQSKVNGGAANGGLVDGAVGGGAGAVGGAGVVAGVVGVEAWGGVGPVDVAAAAVAAAG